MASRVAAISVAREAAGADAAVAAAVGADAAADVVRAANDLVSLSPFSLFPSSAAR
jgi:hypothetical protein